MSKVIMVDESVQTDDNATISSKGSRHSSVKSNKHIEDKTVVLSKNIHDKAYEYLESLEEKYSSELSDMYAKVRPLMEEVRDASNFSIGLKNAVEHYKSNLAKDDKESFMLIQFLEEFYEGFTIDRYYTQEDRESNFKQVLSLVYNINEDLIGNIYDIHYVE